MKTLNDELMDAESPRPTGVDRAPFADQLSTLASQPLPGVDRLNLLSDPSRDPVAALGAIESAVNQVLVYFDTTRTVLSGLDAQDDVEWTFDGRQAVLDVGKTILRAGTIMEVLVTVLEDTRARADATNMKKSTYLPLVTLIEKALSQWHEILELVRELRAQVDVATEWKDLYDQILSDVHQELEKCFELVFEIEEQRHQPLLAHVDVDSLGSTMDESPFMGGPRLPTLSSSDRTVNERFYEVSGRVRTLRASLDFLPIRLDRYETRAISLFPSSVEALRSKYAKLESRYRHLQEDVGTLEKELGEDRWADIFRKTGAQAVEMLDCFEANLGLRNSEIGLAQLDKNRHLDASIVRILALFDRALKDQLTVNGEMYSLQKSLHSRWANLRQRQVEIDGPMDNSSPTRSSSRRSRQSSHLPPTFHVTSRRSLSNASSSVSTTGSTLTPLTSAGNSPIIGDTHFDADPIQPIKFKIRPERSDRFEGLGDSEPTKLEPPEHSQEYQLPLRGREHTELQEQVPEQLSHKIAVSGPTAEVPVAGVETAEFEFESESEFESEPDNTVLIRSIPEQDESLHHHDSIPEQPDSEAHAHAAAHADSFVEPAMATEPPEPAPGAPDAEATSTVSSPGYDQIPETPVLRTAKQYILSQDSTVKRIPGPKLVGARPESPASPDLSSDNGGPRKIANLLYRSVSTTPSAASAAAFTPAASRRQSRIPSRRSLAGTASMAPSIMDTIATPSAALPRIRKSSASYLPVPSTVQSRLNRKTSMPLTRRPDSRNSQLPVLSPEKALAPRSVSQCSTRSSTEPVLAPATTPAATPRRSVQGYRNITTPVKLPAPTPTPRRLSRPPSRQSTLLQPTLSSLSKSQLPVAENRRATIGSSREKSQIPRLSSRAD